MNKTKKKNPSQMKSYAQRLALAKQIKDSDNTKAQVRYGWAVVVALDELEIPESEVVCVTNDSGEKVLKLKSSHIMNVIETAAQTLKEFTEIVKVDGVEIADEKLNMRVNRVFGRDPMSDTPDKLYCVNPAESEAVR